MSVCQNEDIDCFSHPLQEERAERKKGGGERKEGKKAEGEGDDNRRHTH